MPGQTTWPTLAVLLAFSGTLCFAQEEPGEIEVVVSVADQRMVVLREGMWAEKYKISTSKFGLGDSFGSYKTPLGRHRICDKIGTGLAQGAVIKRRNATGEILPVNAPGRDPIVTRILWLEGMEQRNANARSRGIYIHGTVEEDKLGSPVSYGCIRMRSRDVIDAFETLPLGTVVSIQQEKLPNYKRWSPQPTIILASRNQPKTAPITIAEKIVDSKKPQTEPVLAEKPDPKTAARAEALARYEASKQEPADVDPDPAMVPRVSFGGAAALAALKGSILFSDLPGQGPKVAGLSSGGSEPHPEPIAEKIPAPEQLPRVTFRAPVSQRAMH